MASLEHSWLSGRIRARAARHWQNLLERAQRRSGAASDDMREEARDLQQILTRYLHTTEIGALNARDSLSRMELPAGTDWRWRPEILRARNAIPALVAPVSGQWLSDEVALFHDCPQRSLILRQLRNRRATDLSDYALALEIMGFQGSFLSFSLGLPPEAREDLGGHHIIRLETTLQSERPITVYARLNIQQGPNTETILRQMGDPIDGYNCSRVIEFDLGYADMSQRSVDKAWVDVIFEAPYMNAVTLRDVILSRHARAQI
jgi:hypothetical protein